MIGDNKAM